MQVPGGDDVEVSLDADGDALWALAVRTTATRAAAVEVLVGALRSATDRTGLLVAVAKLSRPAPTVTAAAGLTRLDRAAPDAAVLAALDRTVPAQRDVLVLVRLAGVPAADTATALGVSRRAVRRALRVALPEPDRVGPLPDDLRAELVERAARAEDPARLAPAHGRLPLRVVAAATVVLVLVVGASTVALTRPALTRPDPAPTEPAPTGADTAGIDAGTAAGRARLTADRTLAAQAGIPASGNLTVDQHLARCANAVSATGRAADYPPTDTWRLGVSQVGATGITSAVSDAFVCATTPTTVYVSGTSGVRVGDVQLVRAGPGQLGILNPRGLQVTLSPVGPQAVPTTAASFRPVQLIGVFGAGSAPFGLAIRGTGLPVDGLPLPDPGPTAVQLVDNQVPDPDRTSVAGAQLGRCLASPFGDLTPDPHAWNPTTADTAAGTSIVVAHAFGMAGVCAERDGRQVFTSFPTDDPVPVGALTAITQIGAVGGDPLSYTVFSVDPRAVTLEVQSAQVPVHCLVAGGVGVCAQAAGAADPAVLLARDAGGVLVAGPAPLS